MRRADTLLMDMPDEPVYVAEVVSVKKSCSAGHKVGDRFEINTHKTGGICGYCYHELFPTMMNMCYGGQIPWMNNKEFGYECPDSYNLVTFKVTKKR
jgi:uncharacterized repeat protein (TIGR04076 family)